MCVYIYIYIYVEREKEREREREIVPSGVPRRSRRRTSGAARP